MSTLNQIRANRENSQLSTGPKTPEGKAKVSLNRLGHGLASGRHYILADEDPNEYAELLQGILDSFRPANSFEEVLVNQISEAQWSLRRIGSREQQLLTAHPNPFLEQLSQCGAAGSASIELLRLDRYAASAQRRFNKAADLLRATQRDRKKESEKLNAELSDAMDDLFLDTEDQLNQSKPINSSQAEPTTSQVRAIDVAKARLAALIDKLPADAREAGLEALGMDPHPAAEARNRESQK